MTCKLVEGRGQRPWLARRCPLTRGHCRNQVGCKQGGSPLKTWETLQPQPRVPLCGGWKFFPNFQKMDLNVYKTIVYNIYLTWLQCTHIIIQLASYTFSSFLIEALHASMSAFSVWVRLVHSALPHKSWTTTMAFSVRERKERKPVVTTGWVEGYQPVWEYRRRRRRSGHPESIRCSATIAHTPKKRGLAALALEHVVGMGSARFPRRILARPAYSNLL